MRSCVFDMASVTLLDVYTKRFFMFMKYILVLVVLLFLPFDAYGGKEDKIYTLPTKYIAKHINGTKGQKRILMIYASWCPSCVQKMPRVMDIERVKPGSVIAVSIDDNHADFARFVRKMENPPFKVILSKESEDKLRDALEAYGVERWEYIPHFVLFDENNNIVEQGSFDIDRVARFVLE